LISARELAYLLDVAFMGTDKYSAICFKLYLNTVLPMSHGMT